MPTTVIHTIKPAGGGDYTTLSAWEAAQQRNLNTGDQIEVAECYSGQISDNVSVSGWTTNATHYIEIRPAAGHEHGGLRTAGFRLANSAGNGIVVGSNINIRIRGIVILPSSNRNAIEVNPSANPSNATIDSCVLYYAGALPASAAGVVTGGDPTAIATARAHNNFIAGFSRGIVANPSTDIIYAYNNTIVACNNGFTGASSTIHAKNNIVQDCATADFAAITYLNTVGNISSDASSPQTALRNINLDFVDAANQDFHLAPTDTEAYGVGSNLSADANLAFNYDIDGAARPTAWDAGADQHPAQALSGTVSAGVNAAVSPTGRATARDAVPVAATAATAAGALAQARTTVPAGAAAVMALAGRSQLSVTAVLAAQATMITVVPAAFLLPNTLLDTDNLRDSALQVPPVGIGDIDDDPVNPDGAWWTAIDVAQPTSARLGFETLPPGRKLSGIWQAELWLRRTSPVAVPEVDIELWEAGSFVATILAAHPITSLTGQLVLASFDVDLLSRTTGEDVELRIQVL